MHLHGMEVQVAPVGMGGRGGTSSGTELPTSGSFLATVHREDSGRSSSSGKEKQRRRRAGGSSEG